ncbi:hypothetical protein POSPLADRAFT_1182441 [Postia placenta MAD-698-R-SB12]|uniref:KANL3/Tex30 alpha/beta hydrolase-like domain-containing protein n=1 Tax=Postia placenta MAD-698-R-SB12 TaxID=670580 RepID=A0A1X6MYN0_9APHY|nr:hypothetical protein POSPLADRAFT_1182441 [Postia placenta MAD-698-R-SB12]OSX61293.1 hypothetical protein POSPLADRAFT_1182441 [Postia placenta MAD-698-R-SB12]
MGLFRYQNVFRSITLSISYLGATSVRHSSTAYILRTPPPNTPREVPTPLVFVSASGWDSGSQHGMRKFASMFAEKGFTCLELDLAPPAKPPKSSQALMEHYEGELSSHIRLTSIPFAPVIIARGSGALIAQTYISSYPASGLLLISPPASNASLSSPPFDPSSIHNSAMLLPTPLSEFDFEPKFPCAILCGEGDAAGLSENRLWKDAAVDKLVVPDSRALDSQEGFVKIEQWLDEIGV